jgi:hypothetical protein
MRIFLLTKVPSIPRNRMGKGLIFEYLLGNFADDSGKLVGGFNLRCCLRFRRAGLPNSANAAYSHFRLTNWTAIKILARPSRSNVVGGQYCERVDVYPLIPAIWRRYGMFNSLDDQGSQESGYFAALQLCLAGHEKD